MKKIHNVKNIGFERKDKDVQDILRIKVRLSLFENPYVDETLAEKVHYSKENLELSKQCDIQSLVLLKNQNKTLPIKNNIKTILITGPLADAPYEQMGTWAFDGEKEKVITPLVALRQKYSGKINILYEPGLSYSRDIDKSGFEKVKTAAQTADTILAVIGEEAILSRSEERRVGKEGED